MNCCRKKILKSRLLLFSYPNAYAINLLILIMKIELIREFTTHTEIFSKFFKMLEKHKRNY